ncbi:MAG: PaaI family thioesterase [Ardenticatenaceae bacterium]|nr:PaaI family thioesterase [Ardenticatenaceae bacterium]
MTSSKPDSSAEDNHNRHQIRAIFDASHFTNDVGIVYVDSGRGWCRTELTAAERHLQHSKYIHAGVISTMADQTAGAAAFSVAPGQTNPLTVEFKINLLRPAVGQKVICHAQVLKAGRLITVVESEIFTQNNEESKLVAKATVTIANAA